MLILLGCCAAGVTACGPANSAASRETARDDAARELREQLNPIHQPLPPDTARIVAPPPLNPATIFSVPIRSWLPPAEIADRTRLLAGDERVGTSPPLPFNEVPPLASISSLPERVRLPVGPLASAVAPDPARFTAWITDKSTPDARGRPPDWDRPQITSDPTGGESRNFALAAPTGLRETPPPFLRLNIPDPFEQISIAELRNPPPDDDPPLAIFTRPANPLVESPVPPAGK